MAIFELRMPKLGESVTEAQILKWHKSVGDKVALDENILSIATDKVDTDVPCEIAGTLLEILFPEGDTIAIGTVIARLAPEGETIEVAPAKEAAPQETPALKQEDVAAPAVALAKKEEETVTASRFYSPLVKNIAAQEGVSMQELEGIEGTGNGGRVTKADLLDYIEQRTKTPIPAAVAQPVAAVKETPKQEPPVESPKQQAPPPVSTPAVSVSGNVEIVEMDRMRKLIADHMVMSKHTSPHVTSFIEADVTEIVRWRDKVKGEYLKRYNEKITFTPIFIEAVAKALKDFPMVNVSVDGTKIIVKKDINVGMAAALPTGNLIVPVIKNADFLNLAGLTKSVNDLANRARAGQLRPDEIQGGTFTLTNVGSFGNVMGTPIINQPQVAILAVGAIRKKPAVLETKDGDVIAIRQMMFLSLSYDHRVVDGSLGGSFLRRVADYLEQFDGSRSV